MRRVRRAASNGFSDPSIILTSPNVSRLRVAGWLIIWIRRHPMFHSIRKPKTSKTLCVQYVYSTLAMKQLGILANEW